MTRKTKLTKTYRDATKEDFYTGSTLIYKPNNTTVKLEQPYIENSYNALITEMLKHGPRVIGRKVVCDCDYSMYKIEVN